ncbi:MFS transporter [Tahibacter amnicola]|uniref:MFS transporter n=1 Tax=Tahibacter amnicola TaxID=2976241 RepID=A0ABY6B7R7_9GAMM|nr:MFS transporter [Tahibacter amnicola]UXI66049.1 MFS transporter [Tahibacter amnicola]
MLTVFASALAYSLVLPVVPDLVKHSNVEDVASTTGTLMAAYTIATVLLSPLWGWLLDRWSARTILTLGVAGQGVIVLLLLVPNTLMGLYGIRAFQGAFAAAVVPAVLTLAAQITEPDRHGLAVARATRAALLGGLVGPLVGGVLARGSDLRLPLIVASLLLLTSVAAARRGSEGEASRRAITLEGAVPRSSGVLARLAFAAVAAGLAMGAMEVGIAVRGREVLGLNSASIGLMFFGCGVVMILVQSLAFRPQRDAFGLWRLLWPAFVVSAVGLAMLMMANQAWSLSVVVALVAAGGGVLMPTISLWIVRSAGRSHGLQLGLRAALGGFGQAAGAVAAGYAFRAQAPALVIALMLVAATLVAAWLVRRRPTPEVSSAGAAPVTGRSVLHAPTPRRLSP